MLAHLGLALARLGPPSVCTHIHNTRGSILLPWRIRYGDGRQTPGRAMGSRPSDSVPADSQAAIGGTSQLRFAPLRSWIEEMTRAQWSTPKSITWVKRYSGNIGNELADYKAKEGVFLGRCQKNSCSYMPSTPRYVMPLVSSSLVALDFVCFANAIFYPVLFLHRSSSKVFLPPCSYPLDQGTQYPTHSEVGNF